MNTSDQLRARLSNSSDDSPLQEDATDSERDLAPLNEDVEEAIETLDPRNSQLSLHSGAGNSLNDRRHSKRRADYDRLSLSHRVKYLVDDTKEAKKLRQVLHAALDRLDSETQRAKEAERRALELAERFKIVNEARFATQQELDRAHSELRMYKVQLDNAQREILRGSDLLKDIEQQRDSAEAAAARARSMARRLKEEQLMMKAKEEGRREGYQEGLRRGYQQARGMSLVEGPLDIPPAGLGPLGNIIAGTSGEGQSAAHPGRTDTLDGFSMMNLFTPAPENVPLASAYDQDGAGAQGSRFREIMMTPSTLRSAPLPSGSQAGGSSGWPASQDEEMRYIRPTSIQDAPPSSDGYFPPMGPDSMISLPSPHQMHPPPSMATAPLSTQSDDPRSAAALRVDTRDYAYGQRGPRGSPRSVAESLPSTTISQFELVSSPKTATRGLRERSSGLSAIPEVSSSMEFSPGTEGRVLSSIMPEPLNFPVAEDAPGTDIPDMHRTRSRELNQRIGSDPRYSDPEQMDQWRRSTASQSHPSSSRERLYTPDRPAHISTPSPLGDPRNVPTVPVTPSPRSHRRSHSAQSPPSEGHSSYLGAESHRRTESSTPISIQIEPPSGPGSNVLSPTSHYPGMLSPDTSRQELPQAPSTPTPVRPHSAAAGYGGNSLYSYGAPPLRSQSPYRYIPPPSHTPVAGSSTRATPDPGRSYPVRSGTAQSPSFSSLGTPESRSGSINFGAMGGYPNRSRSPSGRPQSAHPSERPPSARPITPSQAVPMAGYPDVNPPVPRVLRSPSRPSSRQSFSQEGGASAARPASRASAGDHQRSLSLHAGSTPAMFGRPLSGSPQIHRISSVGSINSETSRKSGGFQHYDPTGYVDPAFLASTEDLRSMASPNTAANTMANTRGSTVYAAGPSKLRSSSPSMSYASFRS
ncbi:hypothetical protein DICSQDRAFT_154683 [Dichomitus squalens LYAD-421 SS1]|uniref:Uncharacterized protein n=1 Tax=Dichomitus squalens (strain LYAD-421) TaxID=732165 RepID=R7T1I0_DICSQ|nr:uncharacterized protein DICSQDRAFT_154683 [Dichomitus squalens LYAD-421 SS1]EJF62294.1 hypothetical protein DICSQDRAFT_154683 [Dichomitus squalens LYAD-421 SS1]